MTSNQHTSRVVRNPITGEEICYTKGQTPRVQQQTQQQQQQQQQQKHIQQPNRTVFENKLNVNQVKQLVDKAMPLSEPLGISNASDYGKGLKKTNVESSASSSRMANASSIPLLNFEDLYSEDRKETGAEFKKKLNEFVSSNKMQAPSFMMKDYAKPMFHKTSYKMQTEQAASTTESPIISYRNQLTKIPSHLDAPREPLGVDLKDEAAAAATKLVDELGPASKKKQSIYKVERVADLEKLWLLSSVASANGLASAKQGPHPETLVSNAHDHLKEKLVMDTVVTDQLSRFVLSQQQQEPQRTVYTARGNRFNVLDAHTRPISSLSENQLAAKKCKFNCRVRTPNGRIALRELFGIVFLHDGSLTVYEFRLLCGANLTSMGYGNVSKKANALPFLNRRVYSFAFGRRKGQPITVFDVYRGAILYVDPMDAPGLPNEAKKHDYVQIEVTDVNELEKENCLAANEIEKRDLDFNDNIIKIKERLKQPRNELEMNDWMIISGVRNFVRKQIENRSVEVYMGLSRTLKEISRKNPDFAPNSSIGHVDLHESLIKFNIQIHSEDVRIVWQSIDLENVGHMPVYDVVRAYLGEMNAKRHAHFRALMLKLDPQKCGYVSVNDVFKYYRASKHPKVRSGEFKADEMFAKFLEPFDLVDARQVEIELEYTHSIDTKSKMIAYEQWEEFYNGLSIVVDSDDDFVNILKNSWTS